MDELVKLALANSPAAVVILILGKQVIDVAREYLAEGRKQRLQIMDRLKQIEDKLGIVWNPDDTRDLPF